MNDVFVMKAWKEALGLGEDVLLLSNGNLELTHALGVEMDLSSDKPVKLGVRSWRYDDLFVHGVRDGGIDQVVGRPSPPFRLYIICKPAIMGSHVVQVDGYSHLKQVIGKGEGVNSSVFHISSHNWRLALYPN
ncbi:hypothetical protein BAE44_0006691, partial [Dichanthelium oligosanthes]